MPLNVFRRRVATRRGRRRRPRGGCRALSLTDHDSADGVAEGAQAARQLGLGLVSGVEISTHDAAGSDLHILGYRFDPRDAGLAERLRGFRSEREGRATRMAQALRELGFTVDDRRVRELAGDGASIGRPHLAGAVVSDPANRERLEQEAGSISPPSSRPT